MIAKAAQMSQKEGLDGNRGSEHASHGRYSFASGFKIQGQEIVGRELVNHEEAKYAQEVSSEYGMAKPPIGQVASHIKVQSLVNGGMARSLNQANGRIRVGTMP